MGTNTMQMQRVETSAGTAICGRAVQDRVPLAAACPLRWRSMFSIVTVASSTRMPTARARPPRVMMLIVSPSMLSAITEERIESGIDTAMMTVLRQLPRKSRIMAAVRQAAITASRITPLTAARTKTDWSARSWIFRAGGRVGITRGSRSRMPCTTSTVDAAPGLENGDQGRRGAVLTDHVRLRREAVAHLRDVPQVDGRVAERS